MSNEQDVILTVIETEPTQDIVLTAVEPEPTQLITTNEGIVHLPDATRTRKGVVKVGSGLNIESGEISLDESYIKVNEIHLNNNLVTPDEKKRVFLEVDKTTVGLGNVDNTSDANKPVSTPTQTELNKKLDKQQSPALFDKYLHVSADGTIDFVPGVGGLIDVVKRNGVELEITDRAVDVEVPVKTSGLVNDGSDGAHPFITTSDIINNVTSTATDKPLSANMGYELKQQIDNVATIGRYLSQWNCTTGLPVTNPPTLPYEYRKGDYYRVSEVGITRVTKYKPSGTQYTGVASTEVETDTDIKPDDIYFYDGAVWILQKVIVRDVSFGGIIGNPYDNTALSDALHAKQDSINDLSTIRDNASAGKTASDTIATYGDVVTHNANEFVDTTTNQSIGGTKTFTSIPKVNSTNVALVNELPTKVSDLQNDAKYVTESELTQKDYATNTAVSTNYVKKSDYQEFATNVNTAMTELSDSVDGLQAGKADKTEIPTNADFTLAGLKEKSYNSLTDKPIIPDGAKLYATTGAHTDGAMTQKATSDELDKKLDASKGVTIDTAQEITGNKTFIGTSLQIAPAAGQQPTYIRVDENNNRFRVDGVWEFVYIDGNTQTIRLLGYDIAKKENIPTKTSQLTNDSSFATETDITTALATAKAQWLLDMNPIGTIIENNTGTNPSTYIGGTWKLYGQGKVTVCFDSSDNDFGGTVGTTGSYEASTMIADYGSATINLTAGKGKIDHIVYNGTTINNGAENTFINNFYFSVYDKYVLIDSDYDSSQTCTITIYHIPAEGKMSGGSKALQRHTHTATFTGTKETGWFQPLTGGQGKTYATDGKMFTKGSNYSASGVYDRAAGNAVRANLTITPKGTITVDSAGTGDQANLQPYIVVYRWIRTA